MKSKKPHFLSVLYLVVLFLPSDSFSQMITGVWRGKINKQKVELKIIQQGDSLTGTSYYYESASNYRRYSIKGYFDSNTNEAVWWDDLLIESSERTGGVGKLPLLSRADFNCPGGAKMMLDGKATPLQNPNNRPTDVDLDKTYTVLFADEWDYVIENYTTGANDPEIIDSIAAISGSHPETPVVAETIFDPTPLKETPVKPKPVTIIPPVTTTPTSLTIEEKFITRKKVLVTEIPLSGDSVELRFYDNAEIDGDSISLFLNNKLIFQHIRLLGSAYTIKLAIGGLNETNELIMVAENLGSIPPNTSYMVAIVGNKRYEARLESTEGSSAMVRLTRKLL